MIWGQSVFPYKVRLVPTLFLCCTGSIAFLLLCSGCELQEIRSKNKFGTEWRHKGSNGTDRERYAVQPGFEFKWDNGVTTGVSYRRRDDNDGSGDDDNGLFVDVSFPLWKAKKKEKASETARIERLEERIAQLEAKLEASLAKGGP